MESSSRSGFFAVGLAIFSMLFGAGNLMFPIKVGLESGDKNFFGLLGFLMTAVLLPLIGIVVMILFDGDYKAFFYRLGKVPGFMLILASMIIIGPVIAIPRIVTVSHIMMSPFLPAMSSLVFALLFLGITFLFTYKESKIIDVLGKVISPLLLISLFIIIIKGLLTAGTPVPASDTPLRLLWSNLLLGYQTMDLLGAIFFSSIVISILKTNLGEMHDVAGLKRLASFGFKAGLIGTGFLGLIYVGLSWLGVYHAAGYGHVNEGILFREVSFNVMGSYGTFVIGAAVFFACLSTAIALAAVVGDFIQKQIFRNKISFVTALIMLLLLCIPLSVFGLDYVRQITSGPILYIGYPILITITIMNLLYKLCGVKVIKIPVLIVAILSTAMYILN